MFFVGSVIGTLVFGILADKLGRLPILVAVYVVSFVGNLMTIFTTEVTGFSMSRLISGLATDSNFVLMYIIVMEYIKVITNRVKIYQRIIFKLNFNFSRLCGHLDLTSVLAYFIRLVQC